MATRKSKQVSGRKRIPRQDVVLTTAVNFGDQSFSEPIDEALVLSGQTSVGKGGNPVTISILDEITGESMEINHVANALIVVEDRRRSSSGWLSLLIGDLDKIGSIFRLLAKATLDELRRITRR